MCLIVTSAHRRNQPITISQEVKDAKQEELKARFQTAIDYWSTNYVVRPRCRRDVGVPDDYTL